MTDKKRNTTKPAGPPSTKKPSLPPNASGKAKKPKRPPGAGKAKKPKMPPGAGKKAKKPKMPPGFSGDGGGAALTRKDFQSDQDVRWCPGCGDYVILAQVQRVLPELGVKKENVVFISGIGCSGRFPYYMDTYGVHSIHGRAPAFATGLKTARPELDVWIVTGDGDALSIGGNHLIHLLRRNLDTQLLLFNNEIYGLTKGQYSPTSEQGKITKSTPYGSVDRPVNPVGLALGADATFVARTADRTPKHLSETLRQAHGHTGTSFVEIYQNCNVFNDGAFAAFTAKDSRPQRALLLEHGEPLVFDGGEKGVRVDPVSFKPEVISLTNGRYGTDDCLVHDATNRQLAHLLGQMFWDPDIPRPFGVIYREERPSYEAQVQAQIDDAAAGDGAADLQALLRGTDPWTVH